MERVICVRRCEACGRSACVSMVGHYFRISNILFPSICCRSSLSAPMWFLITNCSPNIPIKFHILKTIYSIFHLATERAYGLGRSNRPPPTPTESHQTWCARRRHCLGWPPRNPASNSHRRLRSGVDLVGRASRGYIANLKSHNHKYGIFYHFSVSSLYGVQLLEIRGRSFSFLGRLC